MAPSLNAYDAIGFIRTRHPATLPVLAVGSHGWFVKLLRRALAQLGYAPAPWWTADIISEDFDRELHNLVFQAQTVLGLNADGECGRKTWEALGQGRENLLAYCLAFVQKSPAEIASRIVGVGDALLARHIREGKVNNTGLDVEQIQRFAGGRKFDNWCIQAADFAVTVGYRSLGQQPPFRPGASSSALHRKAVTLNRLVDDALFVKPGYIFLVAGGSTGWRHGGIVKAVRGNKIYTLEGNSNSGGSSDGNGYYARERIWKPGKLDFVRTY